MINLIISIVLQKKFLVVGLITLFLYLVIYLAATQHLIFTSRVGQAESLFMLKISPDWSKLLFKMRAPFLFESIGAVYLGNLKIFLSIPNILIGIMLGTLVAANITITYYSFKMLGLQGVRGIGTLLGAIPAIVSGAACCVPTLILVVGLQLTATLATVWSFFIPASFGLLFLSFIWSLHKIQTRKL